jgi:hypothetical protein
MEENRSRERSGKAITSTRLGKMADIRVLKLFYVNKRDSRYPDGKVCPHKNFGGDGNGSSEHWRNCMRLW